jgi:hypothetical protein
LCISNARLSLNKICEKVENDKNLVSDKEPFISEFLKMSSICPKDLIWNISVQKQREKIVINVDKRKEIKVNKGS